MSPKYMLVFFVLLSSAVANSEMYFGIGQKPKTASIIATIPDARRSDHYLVVSTEPTLASPYALDYLTLVIEGDNQVVFATGNIANRLLLKVLPDKEMLVLVDYKLADDVFRGLSTTKDLKSISYWLTLRNEEGPPTLVRLSLSSLLNFLPLSVGQKLTLAKIRVMAKCRNLLR